MSHDPTPSLDFDPFSGAQLDDPVPFLNQARATTPVFFSPPLGTWVVTRYDHVVEILRDPARFSSAASTTNVPGPPPPPVLEVLSRGVAYAPNSVDLDPPRHTLFRRLINKAFTPRRIESMGPEIERFAHQLIDDFTGDQCELVAAFAHPLPTLVIASVLGVPRQDLGAFRRWSDEWVVLLAQRGDMARLVQAAGEVVAFQRYVADLVAQRRRAPQDDLISAIVEAAAELEEAPTEAELVSLLMTVMFAGHETTTSLIVNTVKQLGLHPVERDRALADRGLIPAAISESLRLDPPVPSMYRTATEAVEIGGVALPAGAHIQLNFAAANRDPARFDEPERFDLERAEPERHLSFGRGIHYCVGAALALLEGRIAIAALYDRLPGLELVPEQRIRIRPSATVRIPERVLARWRAEV
ncbi:cytochrome P450 [Haliangium ochraceum]|uniref:Cytochrome P450 n=1 Tax=Haliangium ochraceum (strain DSM 14365 / JCM 11303 / SMP-2) TaxID=502025 RepID=D0LSK9_HALO1|nr:cytochrome P450 [Haliangium ochraceum]ACY17231.1 cytochrome P450 [Haliangium ochraceum DSM 14365]